MEYQYIQTDSALADYCQQAMQVDAIAVDTEFVRTRTLYPQLGLIQLYDGKQIALVDPLSVNDMGPLKALLEAPNVVKVLHSCSEDLETFWSAMNVVPTPVFDSQFAAAICEMGPTLGYARLVSDMLDVDLDKGESRTDWLARPLSSEQCLYAANDVYYLLKLYPELRSKVDALQRVDWVYAEIAALAKRKQMVMPAEFAYLSVKNNWQLQGRGLWILKTLARWRVEQARSRNLALNFVIREQALVEIAKRQPQSKGALFALPGLTAHEARLHGEFIVQTVNDAKNVEPELYPPKISRLIDYPAYKKVSSAMRQMCLTEAEALAVPVELMGSKKQINQLLKWLWFDPDETRVQGMLPDLLLGWRGSYLRKPFETILGIKFPE